MFVDIEETLGRELREVADGLQIPAMPSLPKQEPPRGRPHWQPLLVAAAVVLLIAGAVAVVASSGDDQEPQPAPAPPSATQSPEPNPTPPTQTEPEVRIPTTAPTIPYVLQQQLFVDGQQVPGDWWSVWSGDAAWLALRTDNSWWWGRGPEANEIEGFRDVPPVISPNGQYVAQAVTENGRGILTGFDTSESGEGLGGVAVDLGDPEDGSTVSIRAVTNDGRVIAQGTNTSVMWLPLDGNRTVDLTKTAPDQMILSGTPAGLVVTDGEGGDPYLAEISDDGVLTRIGALPAHDDIVVSPGGEWMAWAPPGTMGGEVMSIPTLEAGTVDGSQQTTLTAPEGWGFRVLAWAWEDDDHLVSPVIRDGADGERMARCSVQAGTCVLIDSN